MRKREETQKVLRRKQLIPLSIVVFWLAMMGPLLYHHYAGDTAPPFQSAGIIEPTDTWMGIYTPNADGSETKIGYMRTQSKPYADDGDAGIDYNLTLKLATQLLSFPAEIFLTGSSRVSREDGLKQVSFEVDSFKKHVMKASGVASNGQFQLNIETAGESFPMQLPMNKNMMVSGGLGMTALHIPSLEIGDVVTVPTFDPLTFTYSQRSTIECVDTASFTFEGETVPIKILETDVNGVRSRVWVTLDNEAVQIETPFGFKLRKVTPDEALTNPTQGSAVDFLNATAVRPTGKKPFRGATKMTFKLSGIPDTVDVPDDQIQKEIDYFTYTVEPPQPIKDTPLVQARTPFADSLEGDAFVQVEHHSIQSLRDELVDPDAPVWQNALAIYNWCWLEIDKLPVLSFPSAVDVAQSLEGDCNEHTVLFTAIARSAGIPTRMAIGIVWSDELNGFYYHAWPEVYIDQWIPMDPTLGQPVADATHVKFLEGNMDTWPKLVAFLGQVELEVIDIQ